MCVGGGSGAVMDISDSRTSEYSISIASVSLGQKVITALPVGDMHSLAMFINDCVSLNDRYTENDIILFQSGGRQLPLLPGCSYNADTRRDGDKVFVVAIKDIGTGEEIFFPYGRYEMAI